MVLIKQKHQDIIEAKIYDELRTDIGDNIVIHQRGTTQNCPWCKLDTMTNKSANIPADGKDWSTHPNYAGTDLVCPNCNGKYYIQSDVTTTIKVIKEDKEELQLIDGKLGKVDLGRKIIIGRIEDIEGQTDFNDNILLKAVKVVYDGLDYKVKKVKPSKLLSVFGFEATLDRMDRLDLPSSNVLTS